MSLIRPLVDDDDEVVVEVFILPKVFEDIIEEVGTLAVLSVSAPLLSP